jgi:hypothetical protein
LPKEVVRRLASAAERGGDEFGGSFDKGTGMLCLTIGRARYTMRLQIRPMAVSAVASPQRSPVADSPSPSPSPSPTPTVSSGCSIASAASSRCTLASSTSTPSTSSRCVVGRPLHARAAEPAHGSGFVVLRCLPDGGVQISPAVVRSGC